MKIINILCFVLVLFIFARCNNDFDDRAIVRPMIDLLRTDIPIIHELGELKNSECNNRTIYSYVKASVFQYVWTFADNSTVSIWLSVFDSSSEAFDYFISDKNGFSTGTNSYSQKIDTPILAGDCSYNNAASFVRDNILIHISVNEAYSHYIPEIAQSIDGELLNTAKYLSANQLKPVFKKLLFEENPAPKNKSIPFIIDFSEDLPNLYVTSHHMHMRYIKGISFSSIGSINYDSTNVDPTIKGSIYYDSTIVDPSIKGYEIYVIAFSNYGFCSDSTIYIQFE
jgi:hypothetical protein